jgi:hypothetical protein
VLLEKGARDFLQVLLALGGGVSLRRAESHKRPSGRDDGTECEQNAAVHGWEDTLAGHFFGENKCY